MKLWLEVQRLIGLCAVCGLPSEPVFCNRSCEEKYLRWRLEEAMATLNDKPLGDCTDDELKGAKDLFEYLDCTVGVTGEQDRLWSAVENEMAGRH